EQGIDVVVSLLEAEEIAELGLQREAVRCHDFGMEFVSSGFFTGLPGTVATISNTRVGWTAGGGIEYAVTNNWSVRTEYRYSDFGHIAQSPFAGELPFVHSFVFGQHRLTENQIQAGFGYRFDWIAPPPAGPVTAKY